MCECTSFIFPPNNFILPCLPFVLCTCACIKLLFEMVSSNTALVNLKGSSKESETIVFKWIQTKIRFNRFTFFSWHLWIPGDIFCFVTHTLLCTCHCGLKLLIKELQNFHFLELRCLLLLDRLNTRRCHSVGIQSKTIRGEGYIFPLLFEWDSMWPKKGECIPHICVHVQWL